MFNRWVDRAAACAVCNRQDTSWSRNRVGTIGISEINVVVAVTTYIAVTGPAAVMDVVVSGFRMDDIAKRVAINLVCAAASRNVFDFDVCRDRKAAKNSTDVRDIACAICPLRNNGFT